MNSLIVFLALVTVSLRTGEGFVIYVTDPTGNQDDVYPNATVNDPRCKENGIFGNLNDCTTYHSCRNGDAQNRACPEGMRFDSYKLCTYDEDADCGIRTSELECPNTYGYSEYPGDCHKYVLCQEGKPYVRDCPDNTVYAQNVGCSPYNECLPKTPNPICTRLSGLFPFTGDCKKYVQCINGDATVKDCSSGHGYDAEKRRCTAEKATC